MAVRIDDVMSLCDELSTHDQIKVMMKSTTRGAFLAGGCVLIGGMLVGPAGFAVGGVVGGGLAWLTSEPFRPLPEILRKLPQEQKMELYSIIIGLIDNLKWRNVSELINLVMNNATLKQKVTATLVNYVKNKLGVKVQYGD